MSKFGWSYPAGCSGTPDDDAPDPPDTFPMMIGHIRTIAEEFLLEHFGERCPDFEPNCDCCKRWAALDVLIQEPGA